MGSYCLIKIINNQIKKVSKNLAKFKALKAPQGTRSLSRTSKLPRSFTWEREGKGEQLNSLKGKASSNSCQP